MTKRNDVLLDDGENVKEKKRSFSSINTASFVLVTAILCCILLICGVLSYVIPQGTIHPDGTYTKGVVDGIELWRIPTAPFRVFASDDGITIIFISLFLLIMSGVFNLLEKTEGIRIFIGKTIKKFASKRTLVVCITTLVFMAFGSFFGMFEELVTLLPLVVVFMLSMGFDTLTGLGVCMLATCFGFSAAITNPFSVGIASDIAGTYVLQGAWLRILLFAFIFVIVCGFLLLHIRKITKNPEKSLTYTLDLEKRKDLDFSFDAETPKTKRVFKVYSIFFIVQIVILFCIAGIRAISDYAIPILSASFLIGGIVSGLFVCDKKSDVFKYMSQGAVAMLPAVLMIALASSVKLIMTESGIMDTVGYRVIETLRGKNKFACILLIYLLILFLQIFIGSASAKIFLIMPIMLPVASTLGLSPTLFILTYCIADGFTDMILPTNPVLLIGLSMANVSYAKWVKWTWKIQLFIFGFSVLLLLFAVKIGY